MTDQQFSGAAQFERSDGLADRIFSLLNSGLRSIFGTDHADELPTDVQSKLQPNEANRSASLMRVNHTGEVCAQGLYEGQALVAKDPRVREHLLNAAEEERAHLNWCKQRLQELNSQQSVFAPFFYVSSVGLGVLTGLLGDRVSLGFVEATEGEVCKHLEAHLHEISEHDTRSRALLQLIRDQELHHGEEALRRGGEEFPESIKTMMTLSSKIMTKTTRYI